MNEPDLIGEIPGLIIRETIGAGGMGAVYKAYQPTLDRMVALKTMRPEILTRQGLELFHREAKALARIRHPRIVQVLEFHPECATPYILMEYVDGIPLDELLRGRSWKEKAAVFAEVVATVMGAHAFGVVHGDLKPSNILVNRLGEPFVLDFGLAHLTSAEGKAANAISCGGTPAFLAPEMFDGAPSSFQSDIFALGVTLYVLLTGTYPYREPLFSVEGNLRLPLELNPNIPEPLQRICLKAMEADPAARYQTAEQFHADLERFVHGKPIYVRPSVYASQLQGRVQNHLAELQLWQQEGIVSQREKDEIALAYDRLRGSDSPWVSETRQVLAGPLVMRAGAWLLLTSVLLWPAFFWTRLTQFERVASAAVPTALMAVLGSLFLIRKNRRNALACWGSFALMLFACELVVFSEFGWLRYPQSAEVELFGRLFDPPDESEAHIPAGPGPQVPPGPPGAGQRPDEGEAQPDAVMKRNPHPWQQPRQIVKNTIDNYRGFVFTNSQLFAALGIITVCLPLLMYALKAPFFAPWLAAALLGFATTALLLVGDKMRLLGGQVAWVALHYIGIAAMLFFVGRYVEEATAPRVARFFYWTATLVFLVAAVALALFGTKEWFEVDPLQVDSFIQNRILNFWLMTYSIPFFVCGFLGERFGSEGQRNLAWVYYYLAPMFLFFPLNVLVGRGWSLMQLGANPLDSYEVLYLLACIASLVLGRLLHTRVFILVGLWGVVFFVLRLTYRHFLEEVTWPLAVGIVGAGLVLVGILAPILATRRRERTVPRRSPALLATTDGPAIAEAETLPFEPASRPEAGN